MSKILAVFGATGQQGSSVVNHVLGDPELSQQYKIRAIARDPESEKSRQLKKKVEVVQGDVSDRKSLETALTGVHALFIVTTPSFAPNAFEVEYTNGKTVADVAVEKGAEYIVFSTLPSVREISAGKYTKVVPFDVKAEIERYIRGLPVKSAFVSLVNFMENFQIPFLAPKEAPDGTWVVSRHTSPKARYPLIASVRDAGKFVGAILAEPEKYEGKTFCGAAGLYTMEEIVGIMSRATGKTIVYKQVPVEEFKSSLPAMQDVFAEAFSCQDEFGYFGPEDEKLVAWAAENARGNLTTYEEFLGAHPLQL